jgi:hypothetical protein
MEENNMSDTHYAFEAAFDQFLEHQEHEKAESALFSLIRESFLAGWKAAGGEAPKAP